MKNKVYKILHTHMLECGGCSNMQEYQAYYGRDCIDCLQQVALKIVKLFDTNKKRKGRR